MPFYGPHFRERIDQAFKEDPEKEYSSTYLNDLLVNWRDVESRLRHTALIAFVIAALGELLIQGRVTEVQFAGLTIKSLITFQKIVPVIAGYLIYDLCNQIIVTATYRALHGAMIKYLYPKISRQDLDAAIAPPVSLFLGEGSWIEYYDNISVGAAYILALIRPFLIIAAPLAYIFHQFVHLADIKQIDALFWICTGLTGVLIVAYLGLIISWMSGGSDGS